MSRRSPLASVSIAIFVSLSISALSPIAADDASVAPGDWPALQRLIRPGEGEARWATVPWEPALDLWKARKKAAEEGKPLFLWYMAGEPLGMC